MPYVDVPTNAIRRFSLDRFCITPELVAAKHEFVFEGRPVTLQLPSLHKGEVPIDERRIDCYVGSSRVDLQACKLEYSIVSPK